MYSVADVLFLLNAGAYGVYMKKLLLFNSDRLVLMTADKYKIYLDVTRTQHKC